MLPVLFVACFSFEELKPYSHRVFSRPAPLVLTQRSMIGSPAVSRALHFFALFFSVYACTLFFHSAQWCCDK